ncbi:hypothetical protein MuYL_0384 [Mucilaginibacter xinganensis]|uniref:Uncharacterized protein n=1 Tax=Mucilaginibacter xinganensis TaxID=1234841 RepID=A0A223NR17_9SPHI|nr:hypothetical protein MuYL_0384 [Mucilaginibacter xinganensis]
MIWCGGLSKQDVLLPLIGVPPFRNTKEPLRQLTNRNNSILKYTKTNFLIP